LEQLRLAWADVVLRSPVTTPDALRSMEQRLDAQVVAPVVTFLKSHHTLVRLGGESGTGCIRMYDCEMRRAETWTLSYGRSPWSAADATASRKCKAQQVCLQATARRSKSMAFLSYSIARPWFVRGGVCRGGSNSAGSGWVGSWWARNIGLW
jgi:hypothetical protein